MFAQRMEKIRPSETKQFKPLIQELESQGKKVYKFDHGDVNIALPLDIVSQMPRYFEKAGWYKYGSSQGDSDIVSYLADKYSVTTEEIVISAGAKQALFTLALMLFNESDDVVVVAPYWSTYKSQIEVVGANCRVFESESPQINPEKLREYIETLQKPRAILINNPNNPSGYTYSREELREVLNIAKEYEMLVIADEVYGDLVFSGNEFVSMRSLVSDAQVESLYIVGSPSKSHGMSGFRLGYIVANKTFVKQCISVNSQTISNVPVYAQKIWVDVVRHKTFQSDYKAELEQRYNEAYAALKKANLFELAQEKATIYLFPKLPVMRLSDSEYCLHMLKTKGIAMLPGSAFGMPGYVRISVGNSTLSEIQEGMKLLVEETKKLITQ